MRAEGLIKHINHLRIVSLSRKKNLVRDFWRKGNKGKPRQERNKFSPAVAKNQSEIRIFNTKRKGLLSRTKT